MSSQHILNESYPNFVTPSELANGGKSNLEGEMTSVPFRTNSKARLNNNKLNPIKNNPSTKLEERVDSQSNSPTKTMTKTIYNPNKKIKAGYEMASFQRSLEFLHTQSYRKKVTNLKDGETDYEPFDVWGSNEELKESGLGIYLYLQFIRRLIVVFIIMTAIVAAQMANNYHGIGLSTYTPSVTLNLAKLSIGNIYDGNRTDYLITTITDVLSMIAFFIFYLHWRSFSHALIQELEKDTNIVNPCSYAVSIVDFCDPLQQKNIHLEEDLKTYFDHMYRGAYQVEIIYQYHGNFTKFIQYDDLIEKVEKQHQVVKQTGKETDKLVELEGEVEEMEKQLSHLDNFFEPMYAIVHFRSLRAKLAFLNHCRKYHLVDSVGQSIQRCLCCVPSPPERELFQGKYPLLIESTNLSRPEEINWKNIDLGCFSKFLRWIISILLLIISIAITSALIAFCTLYVSSTASCQGFNSVLYNTAALAVAANNPQTLFCFCSENFAQIYIDSTIGAACGSLSNALLVSNVLQVGASVVSSISNLILAVIVSVIAKYLLRPNTIPKQFSFIFVSVFISTYLNTTILPLLLNGDIYGVQIVTYLKSFNVLTFINFQNLSIFSDFTSDWYAIISPYYFTMIIIACITPIIGPIVSCLSTCISHWKLRRNCENNDPEDPLIQKQANQKIASHEFSFAQEQAQLTLFLFLVIMYSGLIPLMIPIFTVGLIIIYICKKTMIVKFSVRIPANENLNDKTITIIPWMILAHALFAAWSHTTPHIFAAGASIVSFKWTVFNGSMDRLFDDIIITAQLALIIAFIVFDFTIIGLISRLRECCKDELEMPTQFAAVENTPFGDRIRKSNILGSYKLVNNPKFGHAIKAYQELKFRTKNDDDSAMKDEVNPERFD